jgi:hypothetical protein
MMPKDNLNRLTERELPEWLQAEVDAHYADEARDRFYLGFIVCFVFACAIVAALAILDNMGMI